MLPFEPSIAITIEVEADVRASKGPASFLEGVEGLRLGMSIKGRLALEAGVICTKANVENR